ncbi:phosphohydrolase [Tepidibacillus sp. HK-1]|uniref:phosphohydrolase n=1 Tax=Tepidibacillus sp. HK-1 TaxID=1883407 RepID=UPI000856FE6A|nr:phosphohydrolase [Tepidibacillus sp. HK-1]GBF10205.1 hypothetical protein HK1_00217 [Tepidibacillus sp. HK-1]
MQEMIEKAIAELKQYFILDEKRVGYGIKVLKHAEEIAEQEQIQDEKMKQVIVFTALFSHIGIQEAEKKHRSTGGKYQELEGPPIAKEILERLGVEKDVIDRTLYIIGHQYTFNKIDGIDFQIIWEAKLLVNLEEKNLYHDQQLYPDMDRIFSTQAGKEKLKKLFNIT